MNSKKLLYKVVIGLISTIGLTTAISINLPKTVLAQAFLDDRCPEQYVYLLGDTVN